MFQFFYFHFLSFVAKHNILHLFIDKFKLGKIVCLVQATKKNIFIFPFSTWMAYSKHIFIS